MNVPTNLTHYKKPMDRSNTQMDQEAFCRASIGGEDFELLTPGGLYWIDQSILFVADLHLGKGTTFRKHGIPIPAGSTRDTLASITVMLQETQANRLVILGDLIHSRASLSSSTLEALEEFIDENSGASMTLVRGNHDVGFKPENLGAVFRSWPIDVVEPGTRIDSVVLSHFPADVPDDAALLLCGHLHPAVRIADSTESLGSIPCFWESNGRVVLPAIGKFTGTHRIRPSPTDRVWLVADEGVMGFNLE